jgi:ubiquinone/menaquinone biosynthesis C-methylase UbiE
MQLQENEVILDVGCGRGYFSIAAAKFSKFIIGLDIMNGFGRQGWWRNFRISMQELNLSDKILGVRSHASSIPFRDSSFSLAVAVHSVRNFQDKESIKRAVSEMKRVVTKKGNVIIVESLPIAKNKAQEAHLQMFRYKVKYTSGELDFLSEKELVEMFHSVGFSKIETKQLNYNLSAAPPFFYLDSSSLAEREREEAKKAYDRAIAMIKKWGDASPPAVFIKATK